MKKPFHLGLVSDRHSCCECGDPSAISYGWWTDNGHRLMCSCPQCGEDELDYHTVYYCAQCAIDLGLARTVEDVAEECGYAVEGVRVLCRAGKVKSFNHGGQWWVLVSEILSDEDAERIRKEPP